MITKPRICLECGEKFKYASNLDKHLRKVHKQSLYGNKPKTDEVMEINLG